MNNRWVKNLLVVIFILFSIHFWRYSLIPSQIYKITDLLSMIVFALSLFFVKTEKELRFKSTIILFLIGLFLNIASAYFNNGQSIRVTFLSFGYFYFILFYFTLHKIKPEKNDLEKIIIAFALLYALFYIIQTRKFPEQIFAGSMYRDRGTIRIRIEGGGFLMLAYFLLLNKYLLRRKIIHIVLALFLFFILIKAGFRTFTLGAVVMSGVIFIRLVKYSILNYALIIVAVILFVGLFQLPGTSRIINNMISTSKQEMAENENNIRKREYQFFSKEYPKNFSYYIVGGGYPGGHGAYSVYMHQLAGKFGFYWEDLGLIGFYFVVGGFALLGLVLYSLKSLFVKLPVEAYYLKIYFGYLLIVSYTTMEIFRPGIFSVEAIGLYLIDYSINQKILRDVAPG